MTEVVQPPCQNSEQVLRPQPMVGLIIGRGGEQISRLQSESKCKIKMAQDSQGLPQHRAGKNKYLHFLLHRIHPQL